MDVDTFRSIFTEFSDSVKYPDEKISFFLNEASNFINSKCPYRDTAIAYLTAHFLIVAEKSKNGDISSIKSISSKSVGDISISYSNSNSNSFYETLYGQKFLEYKKLCKSIVIV